MITTPIDEEFYLVYVLGYDLLHDLIAESSEPECDLSFDKCVKIVNKFMQSEEYKQDQSAYENLREWLENNRNKVAMLFGEWVGTIDALDDDEVEELRDEIYWSEEEIGEEMRQKYEYPWNIPLSVVREVFCDTRFSQDDFIVDIDYWKE